MALSFNQFSIFISSFPWVGFGLRQILWSVRRWPPETGSLDPSTLDSEIKKIFPLSVQKKYIYPGFRSLWSFGSNGHTESNLYEQRI